MLKSHLIALVGMPGSGKTICSEYFVSRGYKKIYFGGIVLDEVKRLGLEINETNERKVREDLRIKGGMGVMAQKSLPAITKALSASGPGAVIEDLYSFAEYEILRNKFDSRLLVIAIAANRQLRYQRLHKRSTRPLDAKTALTRDISQIKQLNIGGSIAIADYTVLNNSKKSDTINQIESIIDGLSS